MMAFIKSFTLVLFLGLAMTPVPALAMQDTSGTATPTDDAAAAGMPEAELAVTPTIAG